jgi:hypothetical protein
MNASELVLHNALIEIASGLRVALLQSLPSDDPIIIGHMRASLATAEAALGKAAQA